MLALPIESILEKKVADLASGVEPAHDLLHFKRVVKTAKALCLEEGAKPEVVIPAAWLHDFVIVPKNDPRRSQASRLSAEKAVLFLKEQNYPDQFLDEIAHAIEAHSYSANISPRTLEAKIVQDADRLDGLGAIGIARCFAVSGDLKRPFYSENDPFCEMRPPEDLKFTTDHFYQKLFRVAETMQTTAGQKEAARRVQVMKEFLSEMAREISLAQ